MNDAPASSLKPSRPTWRQALVMLGGGSLLAASACYGLLRNERSAPDAIVAAFSAAFATGMVLALWGVGTVVVRTARQPAVSEPGAPPAMRPTLKQTLVMLVSGLAPGGNLLLRIPGSRRLEEWTVRAVRHRLLHRLPGHPGRVDHDADPRGEKPSAAEGLVRALV